MKKILILLMISFFTVSSACAEDTVYLAIQDTKPTLQTEILEHKNIEEILPSQDEIENSNVPDALGNGFLEKTLKDDDAKTLQAQADYNVINYTDSLLKEYTTFNFEKGPIETMTPYIAYQGDIFMHFPEGGSYSTQYTEPTLDLGFGGKLRELPVSYKFLFNMMPKRNLNFFQSMIQDDFFIIDAIPKNRIYIGSFRTPIGIEGGTSGYTIPFLTRSQIARNFGSVRGVGTKILGDYDLVQYNIGVTSSDRYFKNFLPGLEFNGLVSLKPLGKTNGRYGKLKIGGSLNAGHREFDYLVAGAHLSYQYKRFSADCEYAVSNGSNGLAGLTRDKADGFNSTLSYFLTNKLQVLARYDTFNADRNTSKRSNEYTVGLNYYIKGSALKIMLNYVFRQSNFEQNSNRLILSTQIIL